jgi:hypothetical protein
MELTYVTIVVLACMIFVLSGMVGYLYWQQTRMLEHIQSLAMAFASHLQPPPLEESEPVEESTEAIETPEESDEDDDRLSVEKEEKVEMVEGPPSTSDIDDLEGKTASQLRDLLTKKGIPFGKRDPKSVLIQLLKASA